VLITLLFLGIAGLAIATCVYAVPAFMTWLGLTFAANVLAYIGATLIMDGVVVAIAGFICWGVKKLFDWIFK